MLNDLKLLLGIALTDTDLDEKLRLIVSMTTARLSTLLGGIDVPESMDHIIVEVAVKRFNRIGSEGLTSHTVEGESLSYGDDDFAEFHDEIQAFLDTQATATRGKVRFL